MDREMAYAVEQKMQDRARNSGSTGASVGGLNTAPRGPCIAGAVDGFKNNNDNLRRAMDMLDQIEARLNTVDRPQQSAHPGNKLADMSNGLVPDLTHTMVEQNHMIEMLESGLRRVANALG